MSKKEPSTEWSRRQLLTALGGVAGFAVVIVVGLGYAVAHALTADSTSGSASSTTPQKVWPADTAGVRGQDYRDDIAAQVMLESTAEDMKPAAPALDRPDRIQIDSPAAVGPTNVPTGFPHTPEGAVGQLGAITVATLNSMSLEYARDVYDAWAAPGADFTTWELAKSIQAFHTNAGTVDGDTSVSVSTTPVGAQIKGTDGPDWVLACVQLDVTAVVVEHVRFGYGHCERMAWSGNGWIIAAGTPPAPAPSTWPASQRSLDAGWKLWISDEVD